MSNIADILRTVPEYNLKIIRLSWELLDENGRIDMKKASYNAKEVDTALKEAEHYAKQTENAVFHLKNLLR